MTYPTLSGRAQLREIDDQEAEALVPGDVVVVFTTYGCAPLTVIEVRTGIAGDLGAQFEVPVIFGSVYDRKAFVYATPDCHTIEKL